MANSGETSTAGVQPSDETHVVPVGRSLRFALPKDSAFTWHGSGVKHIAAFFNVTSVFFPPGEEFFMDSVRAYKDDLASLRQKAADGAVDPRGTPESRAECAAREAQLSTLQKSVSEFIAQESYHTREHEVYNAVMEAQGVPALAMEGFIAGMLRLLQRVLPRGLLLSGTVGLEHLTAVLGHSLLTDPKLIEGSDPHFAALWKWHALEEVEHKAVSYDVYNACIGRGWRAYALRLLGFFIAQAIFWPLIWVFMVITAWKGGFLFDFAGWWALLQLHWGSPAPGRGTLRRCSGVFMDYFRPSFHPWHHDNSHFLALIPGFLDEAKALGGRGAPAVNVAAAGKKGQ